MARMVRVTGAVGRREKLGGVRWGGMHWGVNKRAPTKCVLIQSDPLAVKATIVIGPSASSTCKSLRKKGMK